MTKFFATAGIFAVLWVVFVLWLTGSLITSGIKVGTDSCGTTYSIERVVSGDWFCP